MKLNDLFSRSREGCITFILGLVIAIGGCQLSNPNFGVYQGGDMAFPWSKSDAWHQLASALNPWSTSSLASGYYTADNSSWFLPLARAIGIQATNRPELIQRLEILFIVTLAGLSMYYLVKSLELHRFSAVVTGLIYSFSPVMFNYTVMGWNNLTLTYSSIPLVILLLRKLNNSDRKNLFKKFSLGILAGILFTGSAALTSLFLTVVLSWHTARPKIKRPERMKIQGALTFVSGFLFINAFWIAPRLVYSPFTEGSGLKSLTTSEVSRGARQYFSISSLLTSDYSQYNNSFFVAFPIMMKSLLIGLPVLALMGLFVKHKEAEKYLIKRLVVLCVIFAVLALSMLIYQIGLLGLVFGRDTTRMYTFLFFCMVLLASFYISTILKNQPAHTYTKQIFMTLFLVVQISPFLLGKLESSVLPVQPALTLRPAVISGEFSDIYNIIKENSREDSSVLVVPESPFHRLIDDRARFEPPFNMVSGVGVHLPLPGTWWATDKIPPILKGAIDARRAQLQSGNFSDLWNLMVQENSTMVLVDQIATTPEDLIIIETLLNSGKFLELTKKMNPQRFRLFKSLIPISADRKSYTPINFFNSSQNPIGATIVTCRKRTEASINEPIQFRTPFTFSKNWIVSVEASPEESSCNSGGSNMAKLSSQTSSVDGFLNVSVVASEADQSFTATMYFRPARLQEHLIILTLLLLSLLFIASLTKPLWHKRQNHSWSTSA